MHAVERDDYIVPKMKVRVVANGTYLDAFYKKMIDCREGCPKNNLHYLSAIETW